jgi:diaminopimelate epimerase
MFPGASNVRNELVGHGTGIGADGIVFLDRSDPRSVTIDYFNSDGSLGELCGNATLCTVRLSEMLGSSVTEGLTIQTSAGTVTGRLVEGLPEIDIAPVSEVSPEWPQIPTISDERRLGFALVGVPHVVIEVPDVQRVDDAVTIALPRSVYASAAICENGAAT